MNVGDRVLAKHTDGEFYKAIVVRIAQNCVDIVYKEYESDGVYSLPVNRVQVPKSVESPTCTDRLNIVEDRIVRSGPADGNVGGELKMTEASDGEKGKKIWESCE